MFRRIAARVLLPILFIAAGGATVGAAPVGASPVGAASKPAAKARVITIEMRSISYSTKLVTVKAGEPIDFRFRNTNTLTHEAVIGDEKVQDSHEKAMRASDGGDHHEMASSDPSTTVSVEPGATKTLRYTFVRPGRTIIGCHEPGHYGSGMKLTVIIQPRTALG